MTFDPNRDVGHEVREMIPFTKDSFKVNFINGFVKELVKHFLFIYLMTESGPGNSKISKAARCQQGAQGGRSGEGQQGHRRGSRLQGSSC